MLRPQRVSWKDTNLALIGSDLDHKIKAAAAAHEPQWVHVGESVGLNIWRIEQFIVKPWPKSKYGKFHTGDSYVILNTYQPDPTHRKLAYDIHIWIGSESSQDEYGTAAYKMVELDDKLGGAPIQHREVQGRESELFLSYFHHKVTYLAGGVDTGFHHVEAGKGGSGDNGNNSTDPHLFHIKGKGTTLRMTQEPQVRRDALNEGDVFILTADNKVWMWVGKSANHDEKTKGLEVAKTLGGSSGPAATVETVLSAEPESDHEEFWNHIPANTGSIFSNKRAEIQQADDQDGDVSKAFTPVIYMASSSSGKNVSFRKVQTAKSTKVGVTTAWKFPDSLSTFHTKYSKNNLVVDTGFHCFVWMGGCGSSNGGHSTISPVTIERAYVKQFHRPDELPLTIVKEKQETLKFKELFSSSTATTTTTTTTTGKTVTTQQEQQEAAVGSTCNCVLL